MLSLTSPLTIQVTSLHQQKGGDRSEGCCQVQMRSNAQCRAAAGTWGFVGSWLCNITSFLEGVRIWRAENFHPMVSVPCPRALPTFLSSVCMDGDAAHLRAETHRGPDSARNQTGGDVRVMAGCLFSPRVCRPVNTTTLSSKHCTARPLRGILLQRRHLHPHPQRSTGPV